MSSGKIGFLAVLAAAILFSTAIKAAPSFQDLNIGTETSFDESGGDSETAVQGIPVADAVALQRLLLLLDSLSGLQAGYRFKRPESKNSLNSIFNSLYSPYAYNLPRSSLDMYDGSKRLDRSRKEDKRGSYTPCFFNPVSCFGK